MNAYTQLLIHIKKVAEEDPYITTILHRLPEDFDWEKGNIFPILNISALAGTFSSTSTIQLLLTQNTPKFANDYFCIHCLKINQTLGLFMF